MTFKIKLKPQYDSRKSFYGKANVYRNGDRKVLRSYNTDVAEIRDGKAYVFGTYSDTTLRHIKEFLKQNGFKAENSKQIISDYGSSKVLPSYKVKESSKPKRVIESVNGGKVFRVDDNTEIVTEYDDTKNGFKHTARLFVNGKEVDKSTAHYLNRTWESYEYESVVNDLINKSSYVDKEKKQALIDKFRDVSSSNIKNEFKSIGRVAQLGEVFGKTKEEKNKFKERILRTTLQKKGLSFPADWDRLSEKEKEKRLDKVLGELQN